MKFSFSRNANKKLREMDITNETSMTVNSDKLTKAQQRDLERMLMAKNAKDFKNKGLKVANLGGNLTIEELIETHGENVLIVSQNGKHYAILPRFDQFTEQIKEGKVISGGIQLEASKILLGLPNIQVRKLKHHTDIETLNVNKMKNSH